MTGSELFFADHSVLAPLLSKRRMLIPDVVPTYPAFGTKTTSTLSPFGVTL